MLHRVRVREDKGVDGVTGDEECILLKILVCFQIQQDTVIIKHQMIISTSFFSNFCKHNKDKMCM